MRRYKFSRLRSQNFASHYPSYVNLTPFRRLGDDARGVPPTVDLDLDLPLTKSVSKTVALALSQIRPQISPTVGVISQNLGIEEPEQRSGEPLDASQLAGNLPAGTPALTAEKRFSLITARAVKLSAAFDHCKSASSNQFIYSLDPPSSKTLAAEFNALGLPSKIYQAPYYSRDEDIPEQSKEYAGLMYRLKGGKGIASLEEWYANGHAPETRQSPPALQLNSIGVGGWEYANHPPSTKEIRRSLHLLDVESAMAKSRPTFKSQVLRSVLEATGGIESFQDRGPHSGQSIWIQGNAHRRKETPCATKRRHVRSVRRNFR